MATAGESAASMPPSSTPFSSDCWVFSSGNPRIEETRVLVIFHADPLASSSSFHHLPVGRKARVCVLAVPNHMTYADFCRFWGGFVAQMLDIRIVRTDGADDQYSVLINFDTQISADNFYKHFNGKQFCSLQGYICCVRYVEDVQYTLLIQHAHSSVMCVDQQHTCPVCLERLDQDPGGILMTICNHTFHYTCISKWTNSSCPVCRYHQQPEQSMCSNCGASENLWICLLCGNVGCGRHKGCHDIQHWEETQHCYSLELETRKVWDYAGSDYVHRLIQSKTDEKLVEYNRYGVHSEDSMCSLSSGDAGMSETLLNSKCEAIVKEYNDFITSQLEKHRNYNESLLLELKEENEKKISSAAEKAGRTKLQKIQEKIAKAVEDKVLHDEINENLIKDEYMWKEKLECVRAREKASLESKDEEIEKLEAQREALLSLLMEDDVAPAHGSVSSHQGGTSLPGGPESSSSSSYPVRGTVNRKRK